MAVKEIKDIEVMTIGEIAKVSESKSSKSAPKQKSKAEPKSKATRDPEDILAEALFGESSMAKEVAEELKAQGKNMKPKSEDKKFEVKPFAIIKRLIKKGDTDFRTGIVLTRGRVDLKLESGEVISLTLKEYDSLFDSDKKNRVCRFKPGRSIEDLSKVRTEHDRFEKLEFERKLFESFNSDNPVENVRAAFMTHNAEFRISRDQLLLRLADLGYQLRK